MENKSFTFIHVPDRKCKVFEENDIQDFLLKWSMKGNLSVQYYNFNQPFQAHRKDEFIDSLFKDPVVYSTLTYNQAPIGKPANRVLIENVPCTILSMDFFDRLLNPDNGIVRCDGNSLVQCLEDDVNGFIVDDNLRNTILNEESRYFNLYSESERKQFLWKIFCHLCLGGEWCQYEFFIEPYLTTAKSLYKDLVSVERIGDSTELVIRSIVFKVTSYDEDDKPLVPLKPNDIQDFVYLIVDPFKRSVTVLCHSFGGNFCV